MRSIFSHLAYIIPLVGLGCLNAAIAYYAVAIHP